MFLFLLVVLPRAEAQNYWEFGRQMLVMDKSVDDRTKAVASRLRAGKISAAQACLDLNSIKVDYKEGVDLVRTNRKIVFGISRQCSTYHYNILSDLFDAQINRISKLSYACSIEASHGLNRARPVYEDQLIYHGIYTRTRREAEKVWWP